MLLAIDTASRFISIALVDGQHLLAEHSQVSQNQHTVQLAQHIKRTFDETASDINDLKAVAISAGPGSYSGLRVGFGVAKGIATAQDIPLISVPTLDILASGTPCPLDNEKTLIVVVESGRKRIIAGEYQWSENHWQMRKSPLNTTWENLATKAEPFSLVTGEINQQGYDLLEQNSLRFLDTSWRMRRGGFLAEIAYHILRDDDFEINLTKINPIYLKEP